jgi:hypothetical protein
VRVFLSYRRGDVGGYAGRLTDALIQHLGAKSVFQDVTAIVPGRDYTAAIDRALDNSDAVLAVIGPGWLTASWGSPRRPIGGGRRGPRPPIKALECSSRRRCSPRSCTATERRGWERSCRWYCPASRSTTSPPSLVPPRQHYRVTEITQARVEQLRDFVAGANFARDMNRAAHRSKRTLGCCPQRLPRTQRCLRVRSAWRAPPLPEGNELAY